MTGEERIQAEERFEDKTSNIPESEYVGLTLWKPRAVQLSGYFNIEELELILKAMKDYYNEIHS